MIHGFEQLAQTPVKELDAVLCRYKHERTGLELVWLKRDEENKTFGIAFKTLPDNDTGVFHILEHSLLCGSDKYPVKELFVELMKSSMNTFLNAMTFPDKTVYPVSSRNSKDFMNLVSVYLDAVFAPAIYHRPEIFRQEGWHYEFDEDGSVCYNGVVFNEMKGAYSDPDELTESALTQALFPDTAYHYAYGGDPARIPDLTYEDFLSTHRKFYSPANAFVFLDGDVDLDAVLELLDDEYLSHMDPGEKIEGPAKQAPVRQGAHVGAEQGANQTAQEAPDQPAEGATQTAQVGANQAEEPSAESEFLKIEYEVASEEEEQGSARLILGGVIGDFSEREKIVAMQILSDMLCGNNHAPLSKAVLESGLAEDAVMTVQSELLQPYVKLELRNMRSEDAEQAQALVQTVLSDIATNGIDEQALESAISNAKFRMQERDFDEDPQGVCLFLQIMESWLYGGDPSANLEVGPLFESLELKAGQGFFETLVEEILLNNRHSCKILLLPSHDLGERRAEAEMQRMGAELDSMTEEDLQRLYDEQNALTEWQMSEDEPEALSAVPSLELSDVDTEPEYIPTEVSYAVSDEASEKFSGVESDKESKNASDEISAEALKNTSDEASEEASCKDGILILKHQIGHNGVCYCNMYFDINGLSETEYSQTALLCELLGKLETSEYSSEELANAVRRTFGALDFSVAAFAKENETDTCKAKLCVSYSTLKENAEQAQALALHILRETQFDNVSAIMSIVRQRRFELYQEILMSGSLVALRRLTAGSTVAGVIGECSGGIKYYQYLKSLDACESRGSNDAIDSVDSRESSGACDLLKFCESRESSSTCDSLRSCESDETFAFLPELAQRIFCRSGLTVSYTGDISGLYSEKQDANEKQSAPEAHDTKNARNANEKQSTFEAIDVSDAFADLPLGNTEDKICQIKPWGKLNEGFAIPSDVAYAVKGGNIKDCGGTFSGQMALAGHIISLYYLWNEVRVQGGAYGAGFVVRETGFCGGYSYRDPSAGESLDTFGESGAFLAEALQPDTDLAGDIIGTISDASPLLSVRSKGQRADALFFSGISYEDLRARRAKLLSSTPAELVEIAKLFDRTLKEASSTCVIGPKEQLEACEGIEEISVL